MEIKPKSSAIIVTYNPDESTLEVIKGLINSNVELIVIDNGTEQDNINYIKIKELIDTHNGVNCIFYRIQNNMGLAYAQNIGVEISKKLNVKFVFFLDQDTILPVDYIMSMEQSFQDYENETNEKLGILAPNYFDRNTKEYAHYAYLTKNSYEDRIFKDERFLEVSFVISSGSMMKLETINELGPYIEEFFIDQIDTEYSLRMNKHGYKIIATSDIVLNHTIGNREKKKLFGLTIKPNHHSELRKYYIFRNGQILKKIYGPDNKGFQTLMNQRFIHDVLGVIFYEKRKVRKIKSILKGMRDSKETKKKIEEKNIL